MNFHAGCFVVNYGNDMRQALYDVQNWQLTILGNRFENPELLVDNARSPKKNATDVQDLELQKFEEFETEFLARE